MRPHLELLAALLIDVWRTIDRELLDPGRQRHRPAHARAGPFGGIDDLTGRRIEDAMVERLEPDSDVLAVHGEIRGQKTEDGRRIAGTLIAALLSSFLVLCRP